jgi:hypothetical protein
MNKALGFFLFGLVIILSVLFFARRGSGETKKTEVQPTAQPVMEAVPTEVPAEQTRIVVYAAGTPANGEYPTMELRINGNPVKSWTGVNGNPRDGVFDEFEYIYPGIISEEEVQVAYTNDLFIADDEDRNLYVDRVIIGDATYIADSPATKTTIVDSYQRQLEKKCVQGNTYSRWLRCNGYFTFRSYDKAFIPKPTQAAKLINGTVIKVYAAGTFAGNDYPAFDLMVNNKVAATFKNIGGNPASRTLVELSVLYPGRVSAADVSIVYNYDFYGGSLATDRNLYIDRINIDGVDYYGDAPTVYQTGVWRGSVCAEGYLRSKLLWCQGATMRFGARAL